jgi:hypothetical protein
MARIKDGPQTFRGVIKEVILHTATVDPASALDAGGETIVVAIPGAALGDIVLVGPGADLLDCTFSASVQAAGSVEVRFQNESGSTANPGSSTWTFLVLKPAVD